MINKKIIIPILLTAFIVALASCAVKSRDEEATSTGGDTGNSTSITQTLQLDMEQLLALAQAFDFAALNALAVPASGCTGNACVDVTSACDLFSQGEFIISSYYIKRANYVSAGLDLAQLEEAINAIEAAQYHDGTTIQSILNDTDALSNLRATCSVLISSTTLLLQNQMSQLQVQMASMQQTLISAVANGIPGPTGSAGPVGATGPMGATGPNGSAGPAGAQGPIGHTGATGAAGAQGPTGAKGATGSAGAVGATGPAGATGATGAAGAVGATGAAGEDGYTSLIRLTGFSGTYLGHCTNGGVMIEAGVDLDRNNALDPLTEVTSTEFICNGL